MRISIQDFVGEIPRASPRLLPPNSAQEATNCKLWSRELLPWRGLDVINNPTKTGPIITIYPLTDASTYWMHWAQDVDVARGPIAGDTTKRSYYTGTDVPRVTDKDMVHASAGTNYPTDSYLLGIPSATAALTATLGAGGSGTAVARAYVITFVSGWSEESAPNAVSNIVSAMPGQTVDLSAMGKAATLTQAAGVATAACTGHGFSTGDKLLIGGANQGDYNRVVAITNTGANSFTYPIDNTATVSPATGTIAVFKVAAGSAPGRTNITTKYIYRVATSDSGAAYLFVASVAIGTLTYADSIADTALGEELATTDWLPPPTGLAGLISLPNGVMAGFVGNQVYLSEPYAPYAWPLKYKQVTDFPVVSLGHMGTTIIAATSGKPYLINGIDPAYAAPSQHPGIMPCVSKRGLVSTEFGVLYPSSAGLVLANGGGAELITLALIDPDDWEAFAPTTIHAEFYNGAYIAFYSTGIVDGITQGRGFIIEGIGRGDLHLTELDFYRYGIFLDPDTDTLYLVNYDGTTNSIEEWEGSITRKTYRWKSKVFAHRPTCQQAAKVVARYSETLDAADVAAYQALHDAQVAANAAIIAAGLGRGAVNGSAVNVYAVNGNDMVEPVEVPTAEPSSIEFKLYADGVLRYTKVVADSKPFRLPGGYTGKETEVELSGVAPVLEIVLAENISELRDS